MASKSRIQNVAEQGSSVLLDINDGDRMSFARLHANSSLRIGNSKCSLDALVGSPFGAVFEMHKGQLVRVSPDVPENGTAADEKEEVEISEGIRERDNRNLIDTNTAQTLSSGDIDRMRKDGVSGRQIIDALVANSSSFVQKTAFSQEKYMRKKQKKYAPRVILRRPSARSICEAYFAKDPRKIGHCRMDTLALMLSLANVGPNSDVLVLDSLGGLITAAVAERVGGYGSICTTHYTVKRPPIDIVRLLNIDEATARSVLRAPVATIISARQRLAESSAVPSESSKSDGAKEELASGMMPDVNGVDELKKVSSSAQTEAVETVLDHLAEGNGADTAVSDLPHSTNMDLDEDPLTKASCEVEVVDGDMPPDLGCSADINEDKKAGRPGREASNSDIDRWASQGFTSLLVAAPELDPWVVAEQLLPLLTSSSPFVIYHSYQQPLAECMHQLQVRNMAVALQLSEPWSREYQVLPSRTHPHMQLSATGGYTLSGILIVSSK